MRSTLGHSNSSISLGGSTDQGPEIITEDLILHGPVWKEPRDATLDQATVIADPGVRATARTIGSARTVLRAERTQGSERFHLTGMRHNVSKYILTKR